MISIKHYWFIFMHIYVYACLATAKTPNVPPPPPIPVNSNTPISSITTTKNAHFPLPLSSASHSMSESFSLMLSEDEQKVISNAMNRNKNLIEEALTCHYLGGIVYSTPTSWTLWLNDQAYSNGSDIPGVTILEVTHNKVHIKANNSKSKNGSWLEMGKTFCCDTGQTLAGDQRR